MTSVQSSANWKLLNMHVLLIFRQRSFVILYLIYYFFEWIRYPTWCLPKNYVFLVACLISVTESSYEKNSLLAEGE